MNEQTSQGNVNEERIAEILRRTGVRPSPEQAMMEEIRANVREVWREEVALQKRAGSRYRYAMAAAVVLAAGSALFVMNPQETASYGHIASVVNEVEYKVADGDWVSLSDATLASMPLSGDVSIRTHVRSYASVMLESGMELRLGENTTASWEDQESVNLSLGQLYIDSNDEDGVDKSIRIDTPFGSARDIGTRFAVKLSDDKWQISVREGKVAVSDDGQSLTAEKGEAIAIAANNVVERFAVSADDASWHWVAEAAAPYAIEGVTLATYLQWVAKESGREIQYGSPLVREASEATILHGSIAGLKPMDSLHAVVSTTDFSYSESKDGAIVVQQ